MEDRERFRKAFLRHGFKTGFLKLMVLKLISDKPVHGYGLMNEIEMHTDSDWRPSPGSVYPALQELERIGLIASEMKGRQKVYTITKDGSLVLEQAKGHLKMVLRHMRNIFPDEEL